MIKYDIFQVTKQNLAVLVCKKYFELKIQPSGRLNVDL